MRNDDEFTYRLKKLEELVNRRSLQSISLLVTLILYLYALMVLSVTVELYTLIILIVGFIAFALGSLAYSYHWGRNGRRFIYCIRMLDRISPPHPTILPRFAVVQRPPTYIIARWGMASLVFIRLLDPKQTSTGEVQIPRLLFKNKFEYHVEGIDIIRQEGMFSFPVGDNEYIKGDGILYAIPLEKDFWVSKKNPISSKMLETIIRKINLDLAIRK